MSITLETALEALRAEGDAARAEKDRASLKAEREVLGVRTPRVTELATEWRAEISLEERLALAQGLWDSNIHEARIAAAKLLTQARIRPDDQAVWALIKSWVRQLDEQVLADHVADAGARRLLADPSRLAELAEWTEAPIMWIRRSVLTFTINWARMNNLKPKDEAARAEILAMAGQLASDRDWFIQKAIAWWIRDLSKHDKDAARAFLDAHGLSLQKFARKEASSLIPDWVAPVIIAAPAAVEAAVEDDEEVPLDDWEDLEDDFDEDEDFDDEDFEDDEEDTRR